MGTVQDQDREFLEHFGVKGMKWGVRAAEGQKSSVVKIGEGGMSKRDAKKLAKADNKFEKKANKVSTYIAVHNQAAQRMNDVHIDRINNKPEYKDTDFNNPANKPTLDKYMKEMDDTFASEFQAASNKIMGRKPSTRKLIFEPGDEGTVTATWRDEDVAHADGEFFEPDILVTTDGNYKIKSIRVVDTMSHGASAVEELMHYGVRGMKWGVRKTAAERAAPSTVQVKTKTARGGATDIKVKSKAGRGVVSTKGGRKNVASEDAVRTRASRQKAKASTTDALSNAELKQTIERMQLESKYRKLQKEEPKLARGKAAVKDLLMEWGPKLLKADNAV